MIDKEARISQHERKEMTSISTDSTAFSVLCPAEE